jgi:hypothetical protein
MEEKVRILCPDCDKEIEARACVSYLIKRNGKTVLCYKYVFLSKYKFSFKDSGERVFFCRCGFRDSSTSLDDLMKKYNERVVHC